MTSAWEADLAAPDRPNPPVWIHGDIQPPNVLVDGGRISAVIDVESIGVGDPATHVMSAWSLFSREGQVAFRAAGDLGDPRGSPRRRLGTGRASREEITGADSRTVKGNP